VWLHATTAHERDDIAGSNLKCRCIVEAPDTSRLPQLPVVAANTGGENCPRPLRLVSVGRISPVKNLDFALEVMRRLEMSVQFDLYGPVTDETYWARCLDLVDGLPDAVKFSHKGIVGNDRIPEILASYDLFLLPTLGENFGHAIHEALASGLPVLISDKTPWQDLEANEAGWNLPLGNPATFADKIIRFAAMGRGERLKLKVGARRLAVNTHEQNNAIARNKAMFLRVIEAGI
jgi:glycosyltransferase involved in cell wall biosynthesis